MKKLFVGNLPFSATEGEIRSLFQEYGEVERVSMITDRDTGKPRGFAFVEMPQDGDKVGRRHREQPFRVFPFRLQDEDRVMVPRLHEAGERKAIDHMVGLHGQDPFALGEMQILNHPI